MIIIHWHGYPVCATRIDSLAKFGLPVKVFSEKPKVPFKDFKKQIFPPYYLGTEEDPEIVLKSDIEKIKLLIITGWAHRKWNNLAKKLKKKGVPIIMMVDNNLRYSFRQIIGALYFRFFYKDLANYYLVAGNSSEKLLLFFGVNSSRIAHGYYGFSKQFFPNIEKEYFDKFRKEKNFVFVGQKIKRKGIDLLLKAFLEYKKEGGAWGLIIIGHGPYKIPKNKHIIEKNFLQPYEVREILINNHVLLLPSLIEHWGTIVVEAMSCGMALGISNQVGSKEDLLKQAINGFSFNAKSKHDLKKVLHKFSNLSEMQLLNMSKNSYYLSNLYSDENFANAINTMVKLEKL